MKSTCGEPSKNYFRILRTNQSKGNVVFSVEGSTGIQEETIKIVGSLKEQVEQLIAEGKKTNEAIKAIAIQNGLKKQEVYRQFHELDEE